ncbi:MAG: DUF542 domain-containing protein [Acidobacteriota bacterium]|nr:DUF542 domain-containing protein [Acidobacteriota bacterium]
MMSVNNPATGPLDPQRSVGELVAERPGRAMLFERLHIDYCCGGDQTLADACASTDTQLETVLAALQALDEAQEHTGNGDPTDWRGVDTAQLCEHITDAHHEFLRRAFPRLESLIGTVVRVHGPQDSALLDVQREFTTIRAALEPHLTSEEVELFPAIIAAEQGGPPVPEEIIAGHEYEHGQAGSSLAELRSLCRDYDLRFARCNTHRSMLEALEELELDLHQHVHEENNILFPRARGASRHPPGGHASRDDDLPHHGEQALPACCRGWVAGQGHRWASAHHT